MTFTALLIQFFFADTADVRVVTLLLGYPVAGGIVVSLVQAQMLGRLGRGLGTINHDRVDRFLQQLVVIHIGPGDNHTQRPAIGLDDQATFGAGFAPIRGIRADMIPPKRALLMAPSALCHVQ